ncbi:MAG: hypothetical protein GWN86_21065 [Desulfobacterales bacterium]|nr:hypothetical protein [Desulfobacterales bacterium]
MNKLMRVGTLSIETSEVKCFVHSHDGKCVARFCKTSGEVTDLSQNPMHYILPANWRRWVQKVKEVHGIHVPDYMKPDWRF